jgi:glyoxylate reductase
MASPRIFVTRGMVGDGLERLAGSADVTVWPDPDPPPRDALLEHARRSDGLMTTISDRIDGPLLDAAPSVRVVSQLAVGYDNIDAAAATERGVLVCNTPGVLTDATADLTFALMLAHARRLFAGDRALRNGEWGEWSPVFMLSRDLHGKTLGIVGLGSIGRAVAERARGFKMPLLYWSRSPKPDVEAQLGIHWRDLDDLMREADYISIHLALSDESHGLIDARRIGLMKPEAVLVNTARGPIVDQEALYGALVAKRIGGAALDVFAEEPLDPAHPILALENVVVSPHVGSATFETRARMTDLAVDNLLAFFRGERPPAPVNPEVLNAR